MRVAGGGSWLGYCVAVARAGIVQTPSPFEKNLNGLHETWARFRKKQGKNTTFQLRDHHPGVEKFCDASVCGDGVTRSS
nr:hypothetical protein [Tanacetum cinerariifolium]